jgi:carbonic anhydrase
MRLPVWIAFLPLFTSFEAPAAKWVNIADGAARAVYLDTEGIQREAAGVRAWTREVYTEEQRSAHTGVLYYSANSLLRFDCAKRTTVPMTRVFYGGDGTELRRISLDAVELAALVTPGSLQEQLLERACRLSSDKKPADGLTKVALADTRPKTDVPLVRDTPKAAADGVKPAGAEPAKPAAGESRASEAATGKATKPAAEVKLPDGKSSAEAVKAPIAAAPASKPIPQTVPAKFVEYKPPARVRRSAARPPVKLALAKTAKKDGEQDTAAHAESVHWAYEGKGSPSNWGELKPEFGACAEGKRQSPIDIRDGARLDLEPIRFEYRPSPLRIIDSGYTVQVNYAEGSSITVAGVRYDLRQFHFHRPSEERVNGKAYDMVAHLVHQSVEGRLAVVAVLMEAGLTNPFIGSLWPHLPLESGREFSLPDVMLDLNALLPESRTYYAYMGSLTTPPCTEGVLWLVLRTPVPIATDQVGVFGKLYSMNARPVQPAHGRLIKESL